MFGVSSFCLVALSLSSVLFSSLLFLPILPFFHLESLSRHAHAEAEIQSRISATATEGTKQLTTLKEKWKQKEEDIKTAIDHLRRSREEEHEQANAAKKDAQIDAEQQQNQLKLMITQLTEQAKSNEELFHQEQKQLRQMKSQLKDLARQQQQLSRIQNMDQGSDEVALKRTLHLEQQDAKQRRLLAIRQEKQRLDSKVNWIVKNPYPLRPPASKAQPYVMVLNRPSASPSVPASNDKTYSVKVSSGAGVSVSISASSSSSQVFTNLNLVVKED